MKPLIIQADHSFLLEVENPEYTLCRDFLVSFAELVKSPDYIHTYKTTPLSLWNAAALEYSLEDIIGGIEKYSKYAIPRNVLDDIKDWYDRYGKLILEKYDEELLILTSSDQFIFDKIINDKTLQSFLQRKREDSVLINNSDRGNIKHALIKAGYPVKDLCGYNSGDKLEINLRKLDIFGNEFALRDYQAEAIEAFYHGGRKTGGSGIIVLPCGAGKTIIGLGVISAISNHSLIITTNNISVKQWINELLQKTNLTEEVVGEYTGNSKEIKPITVTTYQMLTYRKSAGEIMQNLQVFAERNWGLIVYDEVHTLPAPIFSATTSIQAKRRIGMTATLVREDGKEEDVFALIGPKRYEVPWKILESRGYIAKAFCTEYRVKLNPQLEKEYAYAELKCQFRIAAENPEKISLLQELIKKHAKDQILIIGQYISQLEHVAGLLKIPLISGKTNNRKREEIYDRFKKNEINILAVSKVANFAVDLPDANILIQISGSYGSRQEEAQRLGRILRPKKKNSYFYTIVSHNTTEQSFGSKRQLFLLEQGYKYEIKYFG
jgi:DNA excision repair protein ERCC-3